MTLSGQQLQQIARDTAASLDDVSNGHPFSPHLDVWKVHDNVFLIVTDDDLDLQIITVEVDSRQGDALRRGHHTITVGHYLDKEHWISSVPEPGITEALIADLVHRSFALASDHRTSGQS